MHLMREKRTKMRQRARVREKEKDRGKNEKKNLVNGMNEAKVMLIN